MKDAANNSQHAPQSRANAHTATRQAGAQGGVSASKEAMFEDNRPETIAQRKLQAIMDNSPIVAAQRKRDETDSGIDLPLPACGCFTASIRL